MGAMKHQLKYLSLFLLLGLFMACSNTDDTPPDPSGNEPEDFSLTVFHINDQHGRLINFAKIKHIVDEQRKNGEVLLLCGGDMFSGNPVVDNHEDKGYPMIDIMNRVGFDVAVLGNHEFDYGEETLKKRMEQADFDWVCANVDMGATGIPDPNDYTTVQFGKFRLAVVGFVETNGKDDDIIPLTHPWKVQNLTFERFQDVITRYADIKERENADLYLALTHLGESVDHFIAENYGFFDLIVGGHSHTTTSSQVNGVPIVQAGANLEYLGKLTLRFKDGAITSYQHQLIDLNSYPNQDDSLAALIADYEEQSGLDEVIGESAGYHTRSQVGCFYTHALRTYLDADLSIQNTGGIRYSIDEGPITRREVFTVDPFNNGSVIYHMTVRQISDFLRGTRSSIYVSGVSLEQEDDAIIIKDATGKVLGETDVLKIAINDYIPAVYDSYFTETPNIQEKTTAETIIAYLEANPEEVDFTQSFCHFRYSQ
jgi:2',3'-cyclic-nucleotide 2'-phosphodiesterase (5'-nucleotidase family)